MQTETMQISRIGKQTKTPTSDVQLKFRHWRNNITELQLLNIVL